MKNRIGLLIITSVIALLALSGIQAFLISNTYQLEKDAFVRETQEVISEIRKSPEIDSLQIVWREFLTDQISEYENNNLSKTEISQLVVAKADSLNRMYSYYYQKELEAAALGYDVQFKKILTEIVIFNEVSPDTLFGAGKHERIKLFGKNFEEEDAFTSHVSIWYSQKESNPVTDTLEQSDLNLEFKVASEDVILVEEQDNILLGRLSGLFLFSFLIFVFVVGLLFYSIKNLITQKKIAEIKTDFVNNITHEFKTPLATLGIATKSLKNTAIKDSPVALENTLDIIDRQNKRLQDLIEQVMNNSLSSKQIILNKEDVVDKEYFKNVVEDFSISTTKENTEVEVKIQSSEKILNIDKFHFTTAIKNVLENAEKYTEEEPRIVFTTREDNSGYIIEIKDNGIGISKKEQIHIFNKFHRVNSGNLHRVKGMGLGLYYSKQIIEAHNGSISVQSEPGKGSCFTINIPSDYGKS